VSASDGQDVFVASGSCSCRGGGGGKGEEYFPFGKGRDGRER